MRTKIPGTSRVCQSEGAGRYALPLAPAKLLDLVEEFRQLAEHADTPESREALYALAYRYWALASGVDAEQITARESH